MHTEEVIREAMKLPVEARAALAGSLLESLDETIDDDAENAWEIEIARRIKEIDEGRAEMIPWSEVRRRLAGG